MNSESIPISKLKLNTGQVEGLPKNPRFIRDEKYAKLKKSLTDDPEMLNLRELVAVQNNGSYVVIMGNMRLRALRELGVTEAPVKVLPPEAEIKKLIDASYNGKNTISEAIRDYERGRIN